MTNQLKINKPTPITSIGNLNESELNFVYIYMQYSYEFKEFSGIPKINNSYDVTSINNSIISKYPEFKDVANPIKLFITDICGITELNTDVLFKTKYFHINSISGNLLDKLVSQQEMYFGKVLNDELLIEWCEVHKIWYHTNSSNVKIADIDIHNIKMRECVIRGSSSGLIHIEPPVKMFKSLYTLSKLQKIELRQKDFYGEEFWNKKKRELDLLLSYKKTIKGKPTDEQREILIHNNELIHQYKQTLYGNGYDK